MASLRRKINVGVGVVMIVVMSAFALTDYLSTRHRLQDELDRESRRIETRLGVSLPKPLWDFATAIARQSLLAEMDNHIVAGILVHDAAGAVVMGVQRSDDSTLKDITAAPSGEFIRRESRLEFEENGQKNDVGKLVLYIDDSSLQRELINGLFSTLLRTVILIGVLMLAIGVLISRLVTHPVDAILLRMRDIADGEGDLTKRVDFHANDELGQLCAAINRFLGDIHRIISEVKAANGKLEKSATMAGQAFDALREPLHKQERELESLVAALNEMTTTSQHVAANAAQAAQKVAETQHASSDGLQHVAKANETTASLAVTMNRAAEVISELQNRAQGIGSILDVIRNIAEQTNLLALNAAIEAARAGDQGRGFAVVADEVRVLAKRTQESTGEIQRMIEQLQVQAGAAVSAVTGGTSQVDASVQTANAAGDAFNHINAAINEISDMNVQIASATEEQTATLNEIDRNVIGIHGAHEKTLQATETTAESEQQLRGVVSELTALISRFRV